MTGGGTRDKKWKIQRYKGQDKETHKGTKTRHGKIRQDNTTEHNRTTPIQDQDQDQDQDQARPTKKTNKKTNKTKESRKQNYRGTS
jgi:hypothetical protein